MKYTLLYYLKNQSELFCDPQVYQTENIDNFEQAVSIAKDKGYKIVSVTRE